MEALSNVTHEMLMDPGFILNEKNVLVTKDFLNKIFKKYNLDYSIVNLNTFINATTHLSYSKTSYILNDESNRHGYHKVKEISSNKIREPNNAVPLQNESYDRLEFLGDSIIHVIITEYIYARFPDQQEGFLTKLRTKLENSETLAKFTQVLGLDTYILISRYMEETNGRQKNIHVLEDVFEAFIGAIYIDNGSLYNGHMNGYNFELCKSLIVQLIESEIDISEILFNEKNYKDILLQYAHTRKWPEPVYGTQKVIGTENKIYEMYVMIRGNIDGIGRGNSKKKGEQKAAESALKKYKVISADSDHSDDECEYSL